MENTLVTAISPLTRKSWPYIRSFQAFTTWPRSRTVWWERQLFILNILKSCKHLAQLSHNPAAVWYYHMVLIECLVANKMHMEQIISDALFYHLNHFFFVVQFCFPIWRLIFMTSFFNFVPIYCSPSLMITHCSTVI